jgi:hypothetical protein
LAERLAPVSSKKSLVRLLQSSCAQVNQHDAQYDGPAKYQGRIFEKEARTQVLSEVAWGVVSIEQAMLAGSILRTPS